MLPGENQHDRVLSGDEESRYLKGAIAVGEGILRTYARALEGIRAQLRGTVPQEPSDPFMLRDVATILLDCGLRPGGIVQASLGASTRRVTLHPIWENGKRSPANSTNTTRCRPALDETRVAFGRMDLSSANTERAH